MSAFEDHRHAMQGHNSRVSISDCTFAACRDLGTRMVHWGDCPLLEKEWQQLSAEGFSIHFLDAQDQ